MKNLDDISKIFSEEELFIIDHYPFLITDNSKYSQIEYDFKFTSFKKKNRRKKMVSAITEFLELMWLYSESSVIIFNIEKRNCRINKKKITDNQIIYIETNKQLREIIKKRIKCCYSAYFVFESFKNKEEIILYLDDVFASVYIKDIEQKTDVEKIALSCGLFVRSSLESK